MSFHFIQEHNDKYCIFVKYSVPKINLELCVTSPTVALVSLPPHKFAWLTIR